MKLNIFYNCEKIIKKTEIIKCVKLLNYAFKQLSPNLFTIHTDLNLFNLLNVFFLLAESKIRSKPFL